MDQSSVGTIESGRFMRQLRPMSVRAIVDDAVDGRCTTSMAASNVSRSSGDDTVVMADARSPQVLANLLAKASK